MNDEDFKRIFLDYLQIEAERHERIMTSNQDVMDAIASIATGQTQLNTAIQSAIADMGTGGDAARAAMVTALQTVVTQMSAMQAELIAAIAAQTPPPVAPAPTTLSP